jgi:hypothetical protein
MECTGPEGCRGQIQLLYGQLLLRGQIRVLCNDHGFNNAGLAIKPIDEVDLLRKMIFSKGKQFASHKNEHATYRVLARKGSEAVVALTDTWLKSRTSAQPPLASCGPSSGPVGIVQPFPAGVHARSRPAANNR